MCLCALTENHCLSTSNVNYVYKFLHMTYTYSIKSRYDLYEQKDVWKNVPQITSVVLVIFCPFLLAIFLVMFTYMLS